MSVVNSKYDDMYSFFNNENKKCCNCDEVICRYPFMCWWGEVAFCGECCHKIKGGFTADLIQVAATVEIQNLCNRYHDRMLVRESRGALERKGAREGLK